MHDREMRAQWRELDKSVVAPKISYVIVGITSSARFRAMLPAHPQENLFTEAGGE